MDIRAPKPVSLVWLWAGRVDDTWDRLKVLAIAGGGLLTVVGVALTLVGWIGTVVVLLGLVAVIFGLVLWRSPPRPVPARPQERNAGPSPVVPNASITPATRRHDPPVVARRPVSLSSPTADALQLLLNEGVQLRDRVPASSGIHGVMAAFNEFVPATEEDIRRWVQRVDHELASEPLMRANFAKEPPEPTSIMRMGMAFQNPLRRRMDYKVERLAEIIKRL